MDYIKLNTVFVKKKTIFTSFLWLDKILLEFCDISIVWPTKIHSISTCAWMKFFKTRFHPYIQKFSYPIIHLFNRMKNLSYSPTFNCHFVLCSCLFGFHAINCSFLCQDKLSILQLTSKVKTSELQLGAIIRIIPLVLCDNLCTTE